MSTHASLRCPLERSMMQNGPPTWPHTVLCSEDPMQRVQSDRLITSHHQFKARWPPVQAYLVEAKKLLYFR